MKQNPQQIFLKYANNLMDKASALNNLYKIVEQESKQLLRSNAIDIILKIDPNSERTYKLLENLLISESNETIRYQVIKKLRNGFLHKSYNAMKWVLNHESSALVLEGLIENLIQYFEILKEDKSINLRVFLLKEIKENSLKELRIQLLTIIENQKLADISDHELLHILIDNFILICFKKLFWRIKYKISRCRVIKLNFTFQELTEIPNQIKYLTSLKILILRYNKIKKIPKWVGDLSLLEELNLNVNELNEIPSSIGNLKNLRILNLWKNDIEELPQSIGSLKKIEEINLRLNRLKVIPSTFGKMKNLKILNLHDNNLKTLPKSIGSLQNLLILNLSWNDIENLPNSIGLLSSLKQLDLAKNNLKNLPKTVGKLKNLEILNLSENLLNTIPQEIQAMKSLKLCDLSRNYIENIPYFIKHLEQLKELYLCDNKIEEIPEYLTTNEFKSLKIIV